MKRILRVDVCDYNNNVLCNLYDNQCESSGEAVDVYVTTERNGWKELTFTIPTTCETDEGLEENYRLQFLKADYRLRTIDSNETDYFLISEPKINHEVHSKDVDVRAGHISQILKNKAIDLEFSDTEGNNVGTAEAILDTILDGTGWVKGYVENFREDDGSIKKRSMEASSGTGALGLIEKLCELFEAKPIYHGDGRIVDIVSMNPFSEVEPGEIPDEVLNGRQVLELYYDRNIKNLEKTVNADTIVTRLYAYGAYGDETTGFCGISTCKHDEYTFHTNGSAGQWFEFLDKDGAHYFFCPDEDITSDQNLIWSYLDFVSRSYVWNETTRRAYKVVKEPTGVYTTLEGEMTSVVNRFPYLLDFSYYDSVGLYTNEMLQTTAAYQRDMPALYEISENAASEMTSHESTLSETGESNSGFAKLSVDRIASDPNGIRIYLNNTAETPAGVIYRSDYDEAEKYYFQWNVAKKFKSNGDPINNIGSLIFVVHNTDPVTWEQAYIIHIYDSYGNLYVDDNGEPKGFDYGLEDDYPTSVTVHSSTLSISNTDRVYLLCTNSMSGMLGAKQVELEACYQNLEDQTTEVTEKHPTYFSKGVAPSTEAVLSSYGWYYKYSDSPSVEGELYFCWGSKNRDTTWRRVYIQQTAPAVVNGNYFFNTKYKTLHHGENGKWVKYESSSEQRVANMFTKVVYYCRRRDMLFRGIYENYLYQTSSLPVGNYAIPNEYAFYYTFTTDQQVSGTLRLETKTGYVYQDNDVAHIVTASVYPYDSVTYPAENDLNTFTSGSINRDNGVEVDSSTFQRSNHIKVYESTPYEYNLPANTFIVFYDINLNFISSQTLTSSAGSGTVTTPPNTRQVRIVSSAAPSSSNYFRVQGYASKIYLNEKMYIVLDNIEEDGELLGINNLTKKFADLADQVYGLYLPAMKDAQQVIKDRDAELTDILGDILRENKWQDSSYVRGDEKRLYKDALDNLKEIAQPEISYSFNYLDMFGANHDIQYYIDNDHEVEWPDIQITDAVHLVDMELDTNCWAYIDRINKCFDQPWLTTIEINTKLSLVGQHDFTDVLSRIAEVAKNIKARQSIYDRAAVINSNGAVSGSVLEGAIALNQVYLNGGASNYYSDPNGNLVFESADGLSAMIIGGRGIGVSNQRNEDGDWQWRSAITGQGLTADVITTGYLHGERIEAGTITVDKLMSNVGQELDIGSNKSLLLFATVNGSRPSGSVLTKNDSMIEISTGDVNSGGSGYVNVLSGGNINIEAGGNVNIKSSGKLDLTSGGEFHLRSNGASSIDSTADGVYVGNDGINLGGGKFKFKTAGTGSDFTVKSQSIFFGDLTYTSGGKTYKYPIESVLNGAALKIDTINGTMELTASNTITISSGKTLTLVSSGGDVKIGNTGSPFTVGSDGTNAYIYNGRSTINTTNVNGCYFGTDGLNIGKANGNYIKATATGNIDITGKITAKSGSIGGVNIDDTKGIYTGSKNTSTSTEGGFFFDKGGAIYLGAYNSTLGATPFQVTSAGALTCTSGTIGGWTINSASLTSNKTGMAKTTNNTDIAFWAGNATASSANFYVRQDGHLYTKDIDADGGTIGAWSIGTKILSASSGSSYVALDGSTDLYPLSGLSSPSDHMYAMWAGGTSPNTAPFSITKDGIITIQKLRIKDGNNSYRTVDFNNFIYPDSEGEDWTNMFGKLHFQTVKGVSQNSSTGRVTIKVTNNSGGTGSYTFNTATSVICSGNWGGDNYRTFTAKAFYKYGSSEIQVGDLATGSVSAAMYTNNSTINIYGHDILHDWRLYQFALSANNPSWGTDHKKTYKITSKQKNYGDTEETSVEILSIIADASSVYNNAWDKSAKAVTLAGSTAESSDTVNKSLTYDEKWIIRGKYYPSGSSIESNTGKTYVVKAPTDRYNTGARAVSLVGMSNGKSGVDKTLTYGETWHIKGQFTPAGSTGTENVGDYCVKGPSDNGGVKSVGAPKGSLKQFTVTATANSSTTKTVTYYLTKSSNTVSVHESSQTGTVVAEYSWT